MLTRVDALEVNLSLSFPVGNMLGKSASFLCAWAKLTNEEPTMTIFSKNQTSLIDCKLNYNVLYLCKFKINYWQRYRFSKTYIQQAFEIHIKSLETSDEGLYSFQVELQNGKSATKTVYLYLKPKGN